MPSSAMVRIAVDACNWVGLDSSDHAYARKPAIHGRGLANVGLMFSQRTVANVGSNGCSGSRLCKNSRSISASYRQTRSIGELSVNCDRQEQFRPSFSYRCTLRAFTSSSPRAMPACLECSLLASGCRPIREGSSRFAHAEAFSSGSVRSPSRT
jgi:hypothetical protein